MITFDIKNKLFEVFTNDTELKNIVSCLDEDESKNLKFRRQTKVLTEVDIDMLPFVSFVFIDANPTGNHLMNKGLLELDIVCSVDYEAEIIYKTIVPLIHQQLEDLRIVAEGEVSSGISGIYCYRLRFKPLVNS